ncbi:hypothetical protein LINGRAHAP2_LOCUS34765 [Linum grandiflorum]
MVDTWDNISIRLQNVMIRANLGPIRDVRPTVGQYMTWGRWV